MEILANQTKIKKRLFYILSAVGVGLAFFVFSKPYINVVAIYNLFRSGVFLWIGYFLLEKPEALVFLKSLKNTGDGDGSSLNRKISEFLAYFFLGLNCLISLAFIFD